MSTPEYDQQPTSNTTPGYSSPYDTPRDANVPPPPPPPSGYGSTYGGGYPGGPGAAPGFIPGPGMPHAPNPMLAGLLGFIPGVGAMYNGQFAKGLAHIAIFAVFASLANHVSDMFGLFVAGWIFYMAFEAYQTARARREGLPLPDPFGLNNIGERFGFHPQQHPDLNHFWDQTMGKMPGAAPVAEETRTSADGSVYRSQTDATGRTTTYQVDPAGNVSYSTAPGAGRPTDGSGTGYVPPVPPPPPGYGPGAGMPYGVPPAYGASPAYGAPPVYGVPPVPPPPPGYGMPPAPGFGMPPMPPMPPRRGGLPTGAIWLIGLGFFALLGSLRPFHRLEGEATGGLFLMGLAVYLFLKRQNASGFAFNDGSPAGRWNMIRCLRGAGVLMIVGLFTFLEGLHVGSWREFGPFLLIFFGVAMFLERTALNNMVASGFTPQGYPAAPPPSAPTAEEPTVETESPTSIVPKYTRPTNDLSITDTNRNDQEGR